MNRVSATDFALDMGFSLKRIINLEEDAVQSLAEYGGLTEAQLKELISWTGQRIGDVRMVFRDEVFVSRALRNPVIRGCPVCLREDAEKDSSRPLKQMTMRGDWQLRAISLCVAHHHPLVPLWEHSRPTDRYDFSTRLAEILPDVLARKFERPRVTPSPYDQWLQTRLETGVDGTWLADKSLYSATIFCALLGTELLRLRAEPATLNSLAQRIGFEVACQGEASIRSALDALAALADGHNDEPQKAFGHLFTDLSRAHLTKDDFAPFRKILRDCIVDVWPVAAGEEVVGFIQDQRTLHSILSAASETGVGPFLLEQVLIHAGAIAPDDGRPTSRKTFDAKAHADLLAEIPTLVGPIEMQQAMGATRAQLISLAQDRVLVPRIDIPTIKSPWRMSDGLALVAELQETAVPVEPADIRWEAIQQAKARSKLPVGTIIAAIRAQQLQVGQSADRSGYAGFRVLKSEIDRLKPTKEVQSGTKTVSAAAFSRSVGMRSSGWFERLAATGHTPATHMPNPKRDEMRVYVSQADAAKFHSHFLTSSTMEREFNLHKRSVLAKLKAAKVETFAPDGQDFGALYLRKEVEVAMEPPRLHPKSGD